MTNIGMYRVGEIDRVSLSQFDDTAFWRKDVDLIRRSDFTLSMNSMNCRRSVAVQAGFAANAERGFAPWYRFRLPAYSPVRATPISAI